MLISLPWAQEVCKFVVKFTNNFTTIYATFMGKKTLLNMTTTTLSEQKPDGMACSALSEEKTSRTSGIHLHHTLYSFPESNTIKY